MSDFEKLAMIDMMIADFWAYNTNEQQRNGAEAFIAAIASVINFRKECK